MRKYCSAGMCMMNHKELQDKQELLEVEPLFRHLGIGTPSKNESPDFIFDYEGKHIGLEHIKCLPTGKMKENNEWRSIELLIEKEVNKSDLPPHFLIYSVESHNEGKKNVKKIANEILNGYKFMLDHGTNHIDDVEECGFKLEKLSYLSFFPDKILERIVLSEMTGGVVRQEDLKAVQASVRKKEQKLKEYRMKPGNESIHEYWLAVYIPVLEFCTMDGATEPFKDSTFDRIYLLNGRHLRDSSQVDKLGIMRLK